MAKNEKTQAELYREQRKARLAKAAKKNSKKSISSEGSKIAGRIIAVVLAIAVVVGIGSVVFKQAGVLEKSRTALKVGDEKISQAEYQYYYMTVYNNISYYNQMYSQYGMSYSTLDTSTAPSKQTYDNSMGEIENFPEDQTPTWADFLAYSAKESLSSIKASVAEANKEGIELDEEAQAEIQSQIDQVQEQADSYSSSSNIKYSAGAFLKANYGKGMSMSLYKKILSEQKLASALEEAKEDEYKKSFTSKQVNKEYNKNIETYGVVTFRSYTINAEKVKGDDDTEAVTTKTMAAAKSAASVIAAAKTEEQFKALVADNEKANKNKDYKNYTKDDSLTLQKDQSLSSVSSSDETFTKWLKNANTAAGSTYIVETADTGYTVYMMVNPIHKAATYKTYDSRHILVKFTEDDSNTSSSEEETTAASTSGDETTAAATTAEATTEKKVVDVKTLDTSKYKDVTIDLGVNADTAKDKEAYKKAQDILEEYLSGDKTATAFGELAEKYSEDTGSSSNGGLYTDKKEGEFVAPYENWCLKDGRKEGDVGIVEYTGDSYNGYHILYFVGTNTVKWDDPVRTSLAETKYHDYAEELAHGDNVAISGENQKTLSIVSDYLDTLVINNARNSSSSSN